MFLLHAVTTREALFPNQGDLLLYFQKAEALARGGIPYRDFPFEYPPLALVAMALPYLAWPLGSPDFDVYRWLFTAWQAILLVGLVVASGRLADLQTRSLSVADRAATVRVVGLRLLILAVAMAPSLTFRFDLLPALLAALAVIAVLERRAGWAGVLLGLGGLVKVYPLVLVPVFAVAWLAPLDRVRLATFAASLGATLGIVLLPFSLVTGDAVWNFMTYQADRGLQLESVTAGLILLVSAVRGAAMPLEFDFGAVHVAGGGAETFLAIQPVIFLAAPLVLTAVGLAVARGEAQFHGPRPETIMRLAFAAIALFIVTNRVISVQYVVWLLPLAALLSRAQFWTTLAAAALSVAIHPLFYDRLIDQQLAVIVILCIRNALLVVLPLWVIADLVRAGEGVPPVRPTGVPPK